MQYVWFLKAACSVKSCHHNLMLLELELLPPEFALQHCKMYGEMLKIVLHPSRSTESQLKILGYITGSRVSHRVLLPLLLQSQFLSPFLFCTIMSLNRNNQQSGWIVYLVDYSPGYRQSLMWRVAWHHKCGIWQRDQVVHSTFFLHTNQVIDVTRLSLHDLAQQNGCQDLISYLEVCPTFCTLQALDSQG